MSRHSNNNIRLLFDGQSLTTKLYRARILFTKDKLDLNVNGKFDKESASFLTENETTISVTYTGGGQHLKERKDST